MSRQASVEDEPAQRQDRAVLLGDRDEVRRAEQAARRVAPADQRLHAGHPTGGEGDDRLVDDLELAARDAPGELHAQAVAGHDRGVHQRLEDGDAIRPAALGAVHRDVGVAQQVVRAGDPVAGRGDADARADRDLLAQDRERDPQRVDDAMGDIEGMTQRGVVLEQDRELVATETGGEVVGRDAGPEPLGHRDEEPVARRMAQGVVDDLEVVEVEEQHDGQRVGAWGEEAVVDLLAEQGPVGEAGQRIVMGLMAELLLEARQLGERLLELPVLERDRRLVGERLEQAQVVVGEARALGQAVDDDHAADEPGLAAQRADHRLAHRRVAADRARLGRVEERPPLTGDPLLDRVVADALERGHHLARAVVERRRPERLHVPGCRVEDDLGALRAEHLAGVVEQGERGPSRAPASPAGSDWTGTGARGARASRVRRSTTGRPGTRRPAGPPGATAGSGRPR